MSTPRTERPREYPSAITALLESGRVMPLDAGVPDKSVRPQLERLQPESLFAPLNIVDKASARLCLAGLWLLYDYLDECHRIAQEIETKEGSYWHAIMHRREGDFSNSKYWFRRVGEHPIFPSLLEESKKESIGIKGDSSADFLAKQQKWDPFRFVDLCEECIKGTASAEELCKNIQNAEWRLLFDFCYEKATALSR